MHIGITETMGPIHPSGSTIGTPINGARRVLLLGAAGAVLGQMAGCGGGAGAAGMGQGNVFVLTDPNTTLGSAPTLPLIPLDPGVADGAGGRLFTLVAQRGSTDLLGGVTTNTLGYNGAVLGPALRLRTGQNTKIRVQNDLGEVTTVH